MDKEIIANRLKDKFGISRLNDMQQAVIEKWNQGKKNIVLCSPTGSGKTLAFAVPILRNIDESCVTTQVVIIEPTRELVLQVTDVLKKLAPSIKTTPCYGGHNSRDERQSLSQSPAIVVATPGRLLDHIEHGTVNIQTAATLVLDEFDKSLELGFVDDMRRIIKRLPIAVRTIMTSATIIKNIPEFIDLTCFETINFMQKDALSPKARITTWQVQCDDNNRLQCLKKLLLSLPDERTIVFANQRDTAQLIYQQLVKNGITAGLYIGTLEQSEREKVLTMFRNGSLLVLVSTDLGGRGLDISDIKHIIHYEQPLTNEIFTHRNGRTARVDATGEVYVITGQEEAIASFIKIDKQYHHDSLNSPNLKKPLRATIHISAGKKEKISRGDIVGYLLHNCPMLTGSDIAGIDIFDHYTLVGLTKAKAEDIVKTISPYKLKKLKVKSMIVGFRPKFMK
ncbi:MAG: DEAD/DEAH box helicase [Muribaculaceae bacterium]|nr:DEAD/DEAH box helicase [Muribaculaceae bacterium]